MVTLISALNFATAFLTVVGKMIDKAPPEAVGAIIMRHEARVAKIGEWFDKIHDDLEKNVNVDLKDVQR